VKRGRARWSRIARERIEEMGRGFQSVPVGYVAEN
jgi:hypothetical protein